jgi:hypothetical protein
VTRERAREDGIPFGALRKRFLSLDAKRQDLSTIRADPRCGFSGLTTTPTPFSILRSPADGPLLINRYLHPEAPLNAVASGLQEDVPRVGL